MENVVNQNGDASLEHTTPAPEEQEDEGGDSCTRYLTLGDGDYTYSLDLARYLQSTSLTTRLTNDGLSSSSVRLVATGVDTMDELHSKYKDTPFIQKQLSSMDFVSIYPGTNALEISAAAASPETPRRCRFHVVMFHHPHLGIEDAVRHGRFLQHLFHAVDRRWLHPSAPSTFHLTLAKGQWERWRCAKAATQQGFQLWKRTTFQPPPPPLVVVEDDTGATTISPARSSSAPRYQHRRHQTGKSFRRRTGGSETFIYIRRQQPEQQQQRLDGQKEQAKPTNATLKPLVFPWQLKDQKETKSIQEQQQQQQDQRVFKCLDCDKVFREERSLRSHCKAVHNPKTIAATTTTTTTTTPPTNKKPRLDPILWPCPHCTKTFASQQSLDDHVRAKHTLHTGAIRPEWASSLTEDPDASDTQCIDTNNNNDSKKLSVIGTCPICACPYHDESSKQRHESLRDFVPSSLVQDKPLVRYACSFCCKEFRNQRAQLQHENFCKARSVQEFSLQNSQQIVGSAPNDC